jgi:hypothetical protein
MEILCPRFAVDSVKLLSRIQRGGVMSKLGNGKQTELKDYIDIALEHGLSSPQAMEFKENAKEEELASLIRLTDFFFRKAKEILGIDFKE